MTDTKKKNIAKALATIFSLALVVVVLSPIMQNWSAKPQDNFPLSYYPMFSKRRPEVKTQCYFLGYDAEGQRIQIPYKVVGSGGLNQYRRHLRRIVRTGTPTNSNKLCRLLARRISRKNSALYNRIVRVQVVEGKFRLNDYFSSGEVLPIEEKIHAEYPVRRKDR